MKFTFPFMSIAGFLIETRSAVSLIKEGLQNCAKWIGMSRSAKTEGEKVRQRGKERKGRLQCGREGEGARDSGGEGKGGRDGRGKGGDRQTDR